MRTQTANETQQDTRGTPGDIMTIDQTADYLQISRATLYRLIESRTVPFCRIGERYRFSKRQLLEWIEGGATKSKAKAHRQERKTELPTAPPEGERFTVKETAGYLDISVAGVRKIIEKSAIPISKERGRIFFAKDDLDEYKRTRSRR